MIKTLNELDNALNKQVVTFGDKQTLEDNREVYEFMETHKMLDISAKVKVNSNGHQILNELYMKDDKLYELETVYRSSNRFMYAIATEIIETK